MSDQEQKKPDYGYRLLGFVMLGIVVILIASVFIVAGLEKAQQDLEKAKKEESLRCSRNLQCLGDRSAGPASIYCKKPIESMAKHSVRWVDDSRFDRFRWADKEAGQITMIGDKAEFQNGFGAYTPVIYECDLDADGKTVLAVRVREGRLP